jgi:hypothetical protein
MSGRSAVIAAVLLVGPSLLAAQQAPRSATERDLERLRVGEQVANLPPADSVAPGARSVAAGTTIKGTVVARGPVDVFGRIEGRLSVSPATSPSIAAASLRGTRWRLADA